MISRKIKTKEVVEERKEGRPAAGLNSAPFCPVLKTNIFDAHCNISQVLFDKVCADGGCRRRTAGRGHDLFFYFTSSYRSLIQNCNKPVQNSSASNMV
jgi:hypothetical protein